MYTCRSIFFLGRKNAVLAVLLLIQLCTFAQLQQNNFSAYADMNNRSYTKEKPYYLLTWQQQRPPFINIIRSLDEQSAIVEINTARDLELMSKQYHITAANNNWKFSPQLAKELLKQKTTDLYKYIISGNDFKKLAAALQKLSGNILILHSYETSNAFIVRCKTTYLQNIIATLPEIIFIDSYTEAHTEAAIIGYSRDFNGISQLDNSIPAANGKNIVVGVKEQRMTDADLDLYKRIVASTLASPATSEHAAVISSIIGGAGNSFYNGRGIANGCKFYSSSFANLFADDAALLNSNKVTVQNHAYGTLVQQFYGAEAVSYDQHCWQDKNFMHIFSAGNSGTLSATEGRYAGISGYANLTGNFKMAKNIITVAAINNTGSIPAESSSGPTYDGRLSPQLTALGPNGTSDAAAVVSGTVAVLQQVYADSNSQAALPASLAKAILYNTAEDIYRTGIDYKTGYGLVNSYAAVRSLQQKNYAGSSVSQGQSWTKNISLAPNMAQIKITLAWTDTVSQVNNSKALINDLDVELIEIATGNIFRPWVLSTAAHADSLAKPATRKRDSLNTAEQISLALPDAGNYTIKVTGFSIPNAPIPFYVAYQVDTLNSFSFINPQHTADVNRAENEMLNIKWNVFTADTNQAGNLSVSYNNGVSWQLIQPSQKLYAKQFSWPIKDTASMALLKMETSFGNFFSKPFVISKVVNIQVDFLCSDSFRLSWNKHIYASSYKIFALTGNPYLEHIFSTTDSFHVFKKADYPYVVYAVEPVLGNNIAAARSIAIDIEEQAVSCFYKTFYYNQLDGNNVDLVLELSISGYVDSIAFERVSPQGQLLQTYNTIKAGNSVLYSQLAGNLQSGITYFRAKMKLKNGAIVYTDIISLLTSGKKNIVFYPNPASKKSGLHYVLMQGLAADNRIQFFDITGRLIRNYTSLPTVIDITTFPTGIIMYKLFDPNKRSLETGRLIIYE